MKHIKNIELFEARSFNKEIRSIGDFLFDKFFVDYASSFGQGGGIEERLIEGGIPRKIYRIEIKFIGTKNGAYTESDFLKLIEFSKYIKPYCLKGFKTDYSSYRFTSDSPDGVIFRFSEYNNQIFIDIFLKPESVNEIKNLPEYQSWYDGVKNKYEDYLIKKSAKKYNL
jgi:hypothetical protein